MRKKILAFILIFVIVFACLPLNTQTIAAPTPPIASGNILDRIEQLCTSFDGKYFTVNDKACTHSGKKTCNNCLLSNVIVSMGYPQNTFNTDAWTCAAFARFAFWYIFETKTSIAYSGKSHTGTTLVSRAEAKPGDLVVFNGHQGIFLSDVDGKMKILDANGLTSNFDAVKYGNTNYPRTGQPIIAIYRANNYDTINDSNSTPKPSKQKTLTIQYDANGGTDAPAAHSVPIDEYGMSTFILSSTKPIRDGYIFTGWKLGDSQQLEMPGWDFTITSDPNNDRTLTYIAQWGVRSW